MANDFKSEEQMRKELADAKSKVIEAGYYAHYKHPGEKKYQVIGVGILESTEEVCVIYTRLETGWIWVRTLEDFTSVVEIGGNKVPRFKFLDK